MASASASTVSPISDVADADLSPTQLSRREWTRITGMGVLRRRAARRRVRQPCSRVIAPHHYALGHDAHGKAIVFSVGLGITAYTLGMRHAFDADHIAAIDNTTRKLMADGQRPVSVGFWFSLGHSSVVFGLCFLLVDRRARTRRPGGRRRVDAADDHQPDRHRWCPACS